MTEQEQKFGTLVRVEEAQQYSMFPVFLLIGDGDIDTSQLIAPISYVLTGEGVFLYRKGGLVESLTRTQKGIAGLGDTKESVRYFFNPMPKELALKVLAFFKAVNDEHHTEALVLPYYNPSTGEWTVHVPKQKVSGGHCDFTLDPAEQPGDGFVRAGSWHSHAGMSAYHSSVDDHDEYNDEGVHLTSGSFAKGDRQSTLASSLIVDGKRYVLAADSVIDGITIQEKKSSDTVVWVMGEKQVKPGKTEYTLLPSSEDAFEFPDEWLDRVEVQKLAYSGKDWSGVGGSTSPSGSGSGVSASGKYLTCRSCNEFAYSSNVFDAGRILHFIDDVLNGNGEASDESTENVNNFVKAVWASTLFDESANYVPGGVKGDTSDEEAIEEWNNILGPLVAIRDEVDKSYTFSNRIYLGTRLVALVIKAIKSQAVADYILAATEAMLLAHQSGSYNESICTSGDPNLEGGWHMSALHPSIAESDKDRGGSDPYVKGCQCFHPTPGLGTLDRQMDKLKLQDILRDVKRYWSEYEANCAQWPKEEEEEPEGDDWEYHIKLPDKSECVCGNCVEYENYWMGLNTPCPDTASQPIHLLDDASNCAHFKNVGALNKSEC